MAARPLEQVMVVDPDVPAAAYRREEVLAER